MAKAKKKKISNREDDDATKMALFVQSRFDVAREARQASGIETIWADAKRAFDGDFEKESETDGVKDRSQIYVQITRSKCVAALASIVSTIFQKGTLPYDVTPSSIPDSINQYLEALGINMADNIDGMKLRIKDQIEEADVRKKVVQLILELIVFGTCFIRTPVTKKYTRTKFDVQFPEGITLPTLEEIGQLPEEEQAQVIAQIKQLIGQAGQFVMDKFTEFGPDIEVLRIWDAFPDPDMRTPDTQQGDWIIHRMLVTKLELLKKVDDGQFDREKILRVLDSDEDASATDHRSVSNDPDYDYTNSDAKYTILRYSGALSIRDLAEFLSEGDAKRVEDRKEDEMVEAVITVIGKELMDVALALDSDGLRQYQLCPYEIVPNWPWGRGIPQNVKDSQSLVNGLTRSLVETKKMSSATQAIMNPSAFRTGEDGKMYPRKVWKTAKHVTDVTKVMQFFQVPDNSQGTLDAIAVFKNMADEHSGIPKVLEGQSSGVGASSRATAFEVDTIVSAANMQLDNVIRNIDEFIISKIALSFYKWNMELSDDMDIKGDFNVIATGYQSFKDKQDKAQKIDMLIGGYGQDPEIRSMFRLEDLVRERLELDNLDRYMWDSDSIQQIREQERANAEAAAQAEIEREDRVQANKFQDQVTKRAEVSATKDEIQKERDSEEALQEQEDAALINEVLETGSNSAGPSGSDQEIADQIDKAFAKLRG